MNQAASGLADRKELWGAVTNERLLLAEKGENKEDLLGEKSRLVIASFCFCFTFFFL